MNKNRLVSRLAFGYIIGVVFFIWGLIAARLEIFPWVYVQSIYDPMYAFIKGDPHDETTILEKIESDADISPHRLMRSYTADDKESLVEVRVHGLRDRRDRPQIWMSPRFQNQYRIIQGAFDFEEAMWGAILIGQEGKVLHQWYLSGEIPELNTVSDNGKILYGSIFYPDGAVAFNLQSSNGGLIKVDSCSKVLWTKKGAFHHAMAPTEGYSSFWTFAGQQGDRNPILHLVDSATGKTLKTVDMAKVEQVNSKRFLFSLHKDLRRNSTHPNDIEVLTPSMAKHFPKFQAGDLALVYHTVNLVFVLNPETLKIRWSYVGAADGPHDVDWQPNATLSLYNNNYLAEKRGWAKFSTIVEINPGTNTHRTIIDGEQYNFWSKWNGNIDIVDGASAVITSSTQGRVFEVDLHTGEKLFDFVNYYDMEDNKTLHMSEALAADAKFVERMTSMTCGAV